MQFSAIFYGDRAHNIARQLSALEETKVLTAKFTAKPVEGRMIVSVEFTEAQA